MTTPTSTRKEEKARKEKERTKEKERQKQQHQRKEQHQQVLNLVTKKTASTGKRWTSTLRS